MSQIFDDVKKNHESELKSIKTNTRNLEENLKRSVNSIVQKNEELQSSIIDLKSRSMRDNLIFSGIPETPNEDCEAVLHHFLENKLKIDEYISFERVHRMGNLTNSKQNPVTSLPNSVSSKTGNSSVVVRHRNLKIQIFGLTSNSHLKLKRDVRSSTQW